MRFEPALSALALAGLLGGYATVTRAADTTFTINSNSSGASVDGVSGATPDLFPNPLNAALQPLLAPVVAAPAPVRNAQLPLVLTPDQALTYKLKTEDRLLINTVDEPRLTGDFVVRSDGAVTSIWIGEASARGRTTNELRSDIVARPSYDYVVNPNENLQLAAAGPSEIARAGGSTPDTPAVNTAQTPARTPAAASVATQAALPPPLVSAPSSVAPPPASPQGPQIGYVKNAKSPVLVDSTPGDTYFVIGVPRNTELQIDETVTKPGSIRRFKHSLFSHKYRSADSDFLLIQEKAGIEIGIVGIGIMYGPLPMGLMLKLCDNTIVFSGNAGEVQYITDIDLYNESPSMSAGYSSFNIGLKFHYTSNMPGAMDFLKERYPLMADKIEQGSYKSAHIGSRYCP